MPARLHTIGGVANHGVADDGGVVETGGNTVTSETSSSDAGAAGEGRRRLLLALLPLALGVFVCATNVLIAVRYYQYFLSKWLHALFLTLLVTSFLLGLFLIVYALVLQRQDSQASPTAGAETDAGPSYLRWAVVPLLVALLAFGATAWAAATSEPAQAGPAVQKPCLELYQEALAIKKDRPNFRVPGADPDQRRCSINQVVLTK